MAAILKRVRDESLTDKNGASVGAPNCNLSETFRGKLGGKSIISPWVLAELHVPQTTMDRPPKNKAIAAPSYALGWMVGTYRGHRSVWHTGRIDGFTAETRMFPDDGMGIVVLNNKSGSARTPTPLGAL